MGKGRRTSPAARLLAVALFLLLACTAVLACTPEGGAGAEGSGSPSVQAPSKTVVDSVGRSVRVPSECTRIAALDSFSGEALAMAGAGPYLVAVPRGVASDVILQQMVPEIADLPSPLSGGAINIESLLALEPDIVLVKSSLYDPDGETGKLDELGIPYLVVGYSTIEEQIGALELIGSLLPAAQQATMEAIVDAYRTGVARVEECAAQVPDEERQRVYHSINFAVITDGAQSLGADWIARTGAIDVSSSEEAAPQGDFQTTLEQVFVWDPDVVICNEATTAAYLRTDRKWSGLRAVRDGNVHSIPIGATRWGQRGSVETWFAMMWLGTTLYPEHFASIDLRGEVERFYGDVLGIEVTDELYAQMLSGEGMRKRPAGEKAGH